MSGAEMQLVRMTPRMIARGHDVATIIKRNSSAIAEMQRLGVDAQPRRINGKLSTLALPVLARVARQHQADIVQSTLSTASWWSGWLSQLGGPPSIGHVQGFTSATWHRHQTHLLAVSNAVKQHLVKQGIPSGRFTVLNNAISPDDFYATRDPLIVRAEHGAEVDTPVVGTFAHLSKKKGHLDLFAAMPAVLREIPKAQFWIIGEGQLWRELHEITERTGVMGSVRFLGFRRDAANLMNAIDVMALPSCGEPCGLPYIEAELCR
jgi:glycosyltransferase involved in cell wall biosynthesis